MTSEVSINFLFFKAVAPSAAPAAETATVREDERRVVLAGERERLRRRPGDRERERARVWKPPTL